MNRLFVLTVLALTLGAPVCFAQENPTQAIATEFLRHRFAIQRCYELELRRNPALRGRGPVYRILVGNNGRVLRAHVELSPRNASLEQCIREVVRRIVFPPHTGGPIEFSYGTNIDPSH